MLSEVVVPQPRRLFSPDPSRQLRGGLAGAIAGRFDVMEDMTSGGLAGVAFGGSPRSSLSSENAFDVPKRCDGQGNASSSGECLKVEPVHSRDGVVFDPSTNAPHTVRPKAQPFGHGRRPAEAGNDVANGDLGWL